MAVDAAADHAARLPFRQFLSLVAALHAHIFVFYLVDFSVEVKPGFLYGTTGRVWFELGRGFLHLVKYSLLWPCPWPRHRRFPW